VSSNLSFVVLNIEVILHGQMYIVVHDLSKIGQIDIGSIAYQVTTYIHNVGQRGLCKNGYADNDCKCCHHHLDIHIDADLVGNIKWQVRQAVYTANSCIP
jgi:hypothetical protein